jgi:hypothetical protein
VQEAPEQFQPEPAIETRASPDGTVSVTVTIPLVAPPVAAFATVIVYEPGCPWTKAPFDASWMVKTGGAVTVSEMLTASGLLDAPLAYKLTVPR